MNNLHSSSVKTKTLLLLIQFFLIIFVYHTLKDLKDSVVITASSAGAEVIPFLKIWGMLPAAVGASFLFSKVYNRWGREKTLYFFVSLFLFTYILFAFILYPMQDALHLTHLEGYLKTVLPGGCRGLVAMICYPHMTLFYLTSELWSVLILAILFWGYVNETTDMDGAKKFYPLCMLMGNFAGIISGQTSYLFSHKLREYLSWEETLQVMIIIVVACGCSIMWIYKWLHNDCFETTEKKEREARSFKDNVLSVCRSGPLFCIALLVIGFGLTSNLIEVVWKQNIKTLYPDPRDYNAYINQITTLIGISAVIMAFLSRWIFKLFSFGKIALITPAILFATSILFFTSLIIPVEYLSPLITSLKVTPLVLVVTIGSIHYVLGMTAKYTIFDTTKEMAFLSVEKSEIMRAKSVIDSLGSRLGKTGASCLYQFLLIFFGSAQGHISVIAAVSLLSIGASILAAKRLSVYISSKKENGSELKLAAT